MASNGLVSAIVTNYNHGEYVYDAVESLMKQTRRPDEVIVVDDASTDHSRDVLTVLQEEYPELIVVFHETNQGVNAALETGIEHSNGEYFSNLGADDPLRFTFFERAMALFSVHPEAGVCTGEHQLSYPDAGNPHPITVGLADRPRYFSPTQFADLYRARSEISIPTAPAVWRREVWKQAGGFQGKLRWLSDWFAALVVIIRHGYGYVPGIMQSIQYNPNSYSSTGMSERVAFRDLMLTVLETIELPEYRDVQPFFRIPAVFSRFGFRMLNVLLENPRYHQYLSPGLVGAAPKSESVTLNWNPAELKSLSPSALAAKAQVILGCCSEALFDRGREFARQGRLKDGIRMCAKALDANPRHVAAGELLDALATKRSRADAQSIAAT